LREIFLFRVLFCPIFGKKKTSDSRLEGTAADCVLDERRERMNEK